MKRRRFHEEEEEETRLADGFDLLSFEEEGLPPEGVGYVPVLPITDTQAYNWFGVGKRNRPPQRRVRK